MHTLFLLFVHVVAVINSSSLLIWTICNTCLMLVLTVYIIITIHTFTNYCNILTILTSGHCINCSYTWYHRWMTVQTAISEKKLPCDESTQRFVLIYFILRDQVISAAWSWRLCRPFSRRIYQRSVRGVREVIIKGIHEGHLQDKRLGYQKPNGTHFVLK